MIKTKSYFLLALMTVLCLPAICLASAGELSPEISSKVMQKLKQELCKFEGKAAKYTAATLNGNLHISSQTDFVRFTNGNNWFALSLEATGRTSDMKKVSSPEIAAEGSKLTIAREGLTEWYVNHGKAMEHGMIVNTKPSGSGPLTLSFAVSGNLAPKQNGSDITFEGATSIRYAGIKAWDAEGTPLPCTMNVAANKLNWSVEDSKAVYPVTIDPTISTLVKHLTAKLEDNSDDSHREFHFGKTIAANGDYVVVGAQDYNFDDTKTRSGAVYIFHKDAGGNANSWGIVKKILPTDNSGNPENIKDTRFGSTLAISNKYLIIGSENEQIGLETYAGAVRIYEKDSDAAGGWRFVKKVIAGLKDVTSPTANEYFGISASIDGEFAVVGASCNAEIAPNGGVVYRLSAADGWQIVEKIFASGIASNSHFGEKVILNGDTLIASAHFASVDGSPMVGEVFILKHNTSAVPPKWETVKAIRAMKNEAETESSIGLFFGSQISCSGDVLAVTAQGFDVGIFSTAGKVYLFSKDKGGPDNWGFLRSFVPENVNKSSLGFGRGLSLSGDILAIGAGSVGQFVSSGEVYIYKKDTNDITKWDKILTIKPQSNEGEALSEAPRHYGESLCLLDKTIFVGAQSEQVGDAIFAGAAYIQKLEIEDSASGNGDNNGEGEGGNGDNSGEGEDGEGEGGDEDFVVFKTTTQPSGVAITVHENHKEAKTNDQLRAEFNTGPLDTMLGANIYEFDAEVTPLKLGYFGFITTSLGERKAGNVTLFKLFKDKPSRAFTYSPDKTPTEEGYFWITDHNNSDQYIDPNTVLEGGRAYTINYSVRDNGAYDLNPAAGTIHDPVVPGTSSSGSYDGAGCVLNQQAGMSVELAGFFIAALIGICARRFRRQ